MRFRPVQVSAAIVTVLLIIVLPGFIPSETNSVAFPSTPEISSTPTEESPVVVDSQVEAFIASEHAAAAEAAAVAQYLAALHEEEQRRQAAASAARSAPPSFSDARPGCEGTWAIPAHIVARESGCNYGAVNRTGCGGYSCVGAYQFDLRHWIAKEDGGWGGCAHLGDWTVPEHQDACAAQMSRGGTYLAPWGG